MIHIKKYLPDDAPLWNEFVNKSKNGTFLFHRNYMDYHQQRFHDHSLLVYNHTDLIALLPANVSDNTLHSHQGLTYGGLIVDKSMRAATMVDIFQTLLTYASKENLTHLQYKIVPHIYHQYPAEEDLYGLFLSGATITRTDISTTIYLRDKLPLHQSKKSGANKARKAGIEISESHNFDKFFSIMEVRLAERYNTAPVHTAAEMRYLANLFPHNIKLFLASYGNQVIAGSIIYITDRVLHTQYIGSTEVGRELRAVDFLITQLIEKLPNKQDYFDFGISNENQGKVLNKGLVTQKEEFGGRSTVYQTYTLTITGNCLEGASAWS